MKYYDLSTWTFMRLQLPITLASILLLALLTGCSSKEKNGEIDNQLDRPEVSGSAQIEPTVSQQAEATVVEKSLNTKVQESESTATSASEAENKSTAPDMSNSQETETADLEPARVAPLGGTVANILWQTDHETGDFYEWSKGSGWRYWDEAERGVVEYATGPQIFGQVVYNSNTPPGDCVATISTDVSRSGNYALKMDLTGATKATQGCRVFRTWLDTENNAALPEEGYYSAWYYLPQEVTTALWWNVFQFKSASDKAGNEAMLSFNIESDGAGKRNLYVYHKKGDESCDCLSSCIEGDYEEQNDVNLPLNEWFHVEAFVKQSTTNGSKVNGDGSLQVWVNDVQIVDEANICTLLRSDARLQWSVNNYTDEITPSDVLLYVDDAAISADRVGTRR